ncbi:hypothetical protein P154DRAFT_73274 [Amniculicola lignicola CBS 123094]|uniref:Uncharacterized protein n=1 Tax=Amniculicola lignicola CBS 123094 TaxID=1392246 RepID=A0A6A5X1A2_9PLEO|nr:hypothetical protein P154DRAFT_73274 [Amniculicola lignicola CBS 123094]
MINAIRTPGATRYSASAQSREPQERCKITPLVQNNGCECYFPGCVHFLHVHYMKRTSSSTMKGNTDTLVEEADEAETVKYTITKPTHHVASILDRLLKVLGVLSAIVFGIWAPITYIATLKSNHSNDEAQRLLLEELKRMNSAQSALIKEMEAMRGKFEILAESKVWEFCHLLGPVGFPFQTKLEPDYRQDTNRTTRRITLQRAPSQPASPYRILFFSLF